MGWDLVEHNRFTIEFGIADAGSSRGEAVQNVGSDILRCPTLQGMQLRDDYLLLPNDSGFWMMMFVKEPEGVAELMQDHALGNVLKVHCVQVSTPLEIFASHERVVAAIRVEADTDLSLCQR